MSKSSEKYQWLKEWQAEMSEPEPKDVWADKNEWMMARQTSASNVRKSTRKVFSKVKKIDPKSEVLSPSESQNLLDEGVVMGNVEKILAAVESGAKIDRVGRDGMNALMEATDRGNRDVVFLLVKLGANVNAKTEDGITALYFAIVNHDKELVDDLISLGADVNNATEEDVTPLLEAFYCGASHWIVRSLLRAGADPSYQCENTDDTPIELAFSDDRVEIRRLFQEFSEEAMGEDEYVNDGVLQDSAFVDPKKLMN